MRIETGLKLGLVAMVTVLGASQALAEVPCDEAKFGSERWRECCLQNRR